MKLSNNYYTPLPIIRTSKQQASNKHVTEAKTPGLQLRRRSWPETQGPRSLTRGLSKTRISGPNAPPRPPGGPRKGGGGPETAKNGAKRPKTAVSQARRSKSQIRGQLSAVQPPRFGGFHASNGPQRTPSTPYRPLGLILGQFGPQQPVNLARYGSKNGQK